MSAPIVERLRKAAHGPLHERTGVLVTEAADAIEALLAALEGMVADVMSVDAETLLSTPWMACCTQSKLDAARAAIAKARA